MLDHVYAILNAVCVTQIPRKHLQSSCFACDRCASMYQTYVLAFVLPHCLNQIDGTHNIVCIIQHRKLNALSNSFTPSKMNDSVKPAATFDCSFAA